MSIFPAIQYFITVHQPVRSAMKNKHLVLLMFSFLATIAGTYFFKQVNASSLILTNTPSQAVFITYETDNEAQDFNLRNIDGTMVSLAKYTDAKGFILVFTSNHCPFSKVYEDRIIALNAKYASRGYPVIAINPNDPAAYEDDSFENMKARAGEKNYTFPYLVDDKGVGQRYGATRTPHVFVLRKENGKNIVKYTGAIDDNPQDPSSVTRKYVEDAVDNLIQNKPVVTTSTKAIGCSIKWRN
jgi:glutathione peroxidase-family protein